MRTPDPEQQKAIDAQDGFFLVLAPPGCGKTDILAERILRASADTALEDMLCLTFTNRASHGMRERIEEVLGKDADGLFVGNIHHFCSSFLFSEKLLPHSTSIVDEEDLTDILIALFPNIFHENCERRDWASQVFLAMENLTHDRLGIPRELRNAPAMPDTQTRISSDIDGYALHAKTLRQYLDDHNLITFSDLLALTYAALRNDTEHRHKRYKWIQVDEVQDLCPLQLAIVDLLTDRDNNPTILYLGDEQQAIFSFLGAKTEVLEELKHRCQGHVLTLGHNYRSPSYLLEVFNTYAQEEMGMDPDLLPQPVVHTEKDRHALIVTGNDDSEKELDRLPGMVQFYLRDPQERLAFLVPTNSLADKVSERLTKLGVSHFKISGSDMFRAPGYKALSSLFAVSALDTDAMSWTRILHTTGATATLKDGRSLSYKMRNLSMTPNDLLDDESLLARFCQEYREREMVFFDTETTGLNILQDDIVQIAAYKVKGGKKVEGSDLVLFLHTDREIPSHLGEKVNPLVDAYAKATPLPRKEGLELFLDYIGDDPVLGHNVDYDYHILRHNVLRTLHREITLQTYDSLHLIRLVEPSLISHKLEYLLEALHLPGQNSHLADDDIAATKAVVDYCVKKTTPLLEEQRAFLDLPETRKAAKKMEAVRPLMEALQEQLHEHICLSEALRAAYAYCLEHGLIESLGDKFELFLAYVKSEWDSADDTLADQIATHRADLTSGISEGDLVNSQGLERDRVFVMTVHKAKGLEFDNVVLLHANDGTYPFYITKRTLEQPWRYSKQALATARQELKEDARKFYVAISRAKKRLCISYILTNSFGHYVGPTPFLKSIMKYFG